ncbi:MAG: 23S rRNA (adenine(1618)-N(6))-methyltransferase RlmF [Flavobacteriaceae bacterium]|nr:23S rRNA (adenine(1618)-N(6))-methyltransferase RlmF [Flavobacteriaceae bacterium]
MKPSKSKFHLNNKHQKGYDFYKLYKVYPLLSEFVFENKYQTTTIDFSDPKAIKALNTALLFLHYKITYWNFPDDNLCPPIPGRVDYIHHLADLLKSSSIDKNARILDIGTGASCIYPLLGNAEYNWQFVGTDIDKKTLDSAQHIIDENNLFKNISLRLQPDRSNILKGVLSATDRFDIAMCNPPFHDSDETATTATKRKLKGLGKETIFIRNFGGKHNELWYKGGEKAFIHNYIYESSLFKKQCCWFSTLVSKKENIRPIKVLLKKLKATEVKMIPMHQGNKITRIIAWTFLTEAEQKKWKDGF